MSRNRCAMACVCGWDLEQAAKIGPPLTEEDYLARVGQMRYYGNSGHGWVHGSHLTGRARFQQLLCPICGRVYAGWVAEKIMRPGEYELFDSSFFYAFNDEPSEKDEPLTSMSLEDILVAWAAAGRPGLKR